MLLAAEDAFEFERFQEAGPLTADVDAEATAAEIAEFSALGIAMPANLDGLRRELEHAPKVREAIHGAAGALRRSGRADASALVALAPRGLVGPGGPGMAGGFPGMDPRMMDPRMMDPRMMDPRFAGARGFAAGPASAGVAAGVGALRDERERPSRRRERTVGTAAVVGSDGPVEAEVVEGYAHDDGHDDDYDDDFEDEVRELRPRERRRPPREARPSRSERARRARAARPRDDEWDEDDDAVDDDYDDSMILARPAGTDNKTTWILGAIAGVAVIALLWVLIGEDDKAGEGQQAANQQPPAPAGQQQPVQPETPPPAAPQEPLPGVDPNAAPTEAAPTPSSGGRAPSRSGGGGSRSAGGGSGGSGSVNPFGGYTPPGKDPIPGGESKPADGGESKPAEGGEAKPAEGGEAEPAEGGEAKPAEGGEQAKPAEGSEAKPAPAEEPKPEENILPKSKMTPAIRSAITNKVGVLQRCYEDALVGKPDLAGRVVFTITMDQDGVVEKVQIAKDEVKYGVAKCAAKKIRGWTLPPTGLPFRFDLPFDFKQPG